MKRWIVTGVIVLSYSLSCWSQDSYCITLAGDTLVGNIKMDGDMLTIKKRKESRTLFPDEVVGYYDKNSNTYFYSKPVRYTENSVVYGYLKLEVRGAINLYSRTFKIQESVEKKMFLSEEDKALLKKYGEDTKSSNRTIDPNGLYASPPKENEVEYYLESETAKIQLATTDIVYDFVRGDREATDRVGDPKFKIEKHLEDLVREYDKRH